MLLTGMIVGWSSRIAADVIVANSLRIKDRATGKALMSTSTTIPGIISPIIAAYIVTAFGGISAEGIRPLFWIMFFSQLLILIYTFATLEEHGQAINSESKAISTIHRSEVNA